MIRRARYVAVAALAVTALAGCSALGGSDSGSSGGNGQVEKAKIKVAVIPGLIDIAGYKRAQAAGYFKAEGLDVEDVSIKTGAQAPPMLINTPSKIPKKRISRFFCRNIKIPVN